MSRFRQNFDLAWALLIRRGVANALLTMLSLWSQIFRREKLEHINIDVLNGIAALYTLSAFINHASWTWGFNSKYEIPQVQKNKCGFVVSLD